MVIHDWVVLIMWFTTLLVALWGQHWYDKAKRLQDAIEYMVEDGLPESEAPSE